MKLESEFYSRNNVVDIARDLIGKNLFAKINGKITSGIITETEAYAGITDKASHAFGGRRTKRTEVMYAQGGLSYVYLCYGVHHLFNVVTNVCGIPHAVLIRGMVPIDGETEMLRRCNKNSLNKIADGPGKLTKAMGINMDFNKVDLCSGKLWIEDNGVIVPDKKIKISKRIGIDYAEEDAHLPYRFNLIP